MQKVDKLKIDTPVSKLCRNNANTTNNHERETTLW